MKGSYFTRKRYAITAFLGSILTIAALVTYIIGSQGAQPTLASQYIATASAKNKVVGTIKTKDNKLANSAKVSLVFEVKQGKKNKRVTVKPKVKKGHFTAAVPKGAKRVVVSILESGRSKDGAITNNFKIRPGKNLKLTLSFPKRIDSGAQLVGIFPY